MRVRAVLLDRDDTLIRNVPYNGDPTLVVPLPGARAAVDLLRAAGLRTGVVTNQSGIGRGLITAGQLRAVNARVEEVLGAFDTWQYCPHLPDDECGCRKPRPGMVHAAAHAMEVESTECVVIGDTAGDMGAARAAGAYAVLVPAEQTSQDAVQMANIVVPELRSAVAHVLTGLLSLP